MNGSAHFRPLSVCGWCVFLAVSYAPLLGALLVGASEPWPADLTLTSPRRLGLLFNSFSLSAAVALVVIAVGTLAAVALLRQRATAQAWLQWLLLASVAVPPTVQALAWCEAIGVLSRAWNLSLLGDWWTAAAVQAMALLPFGTGLALAALRSVDSRLLDAGRMQAPPLTLLRRVVLPLARPLLACAGVFVFLLSLLDYTLPSIFGVNVYAMEAFVAFSASHSVLESLWIALPLLLVTLLSLAVVVRLPRHLAQQATARFPSDGRLPVLWAIAAGLAVLLVAMALLLPLYSLASGLVNARGLVETLVASRPQLIDTLALNLPVAVLAVLTAVVPAAWLAFAAAGRSRLWVLVLFPFLLPPTLTGVGLIAVSHRLLPISVEAGDALLVLGLLSRLTPLAVCVLTAWFLRMDPTLLEAALVLSRSMLQALMRIALPLARPALLAAASLVFVLGIGDVGTSLLLLPPGSETLAIKTYNYLHYGGSRSAAGLCAMLLLLALLSPPLFWLLAKASRLLHRRHRW